MKTFTTYAEKKAKQFFNLLQGYTKGIRITTILILLLMGVSNAWGATVTLRYEANMPSGNYNASNSQTMTVSSIDGNRYYCELSLSANTSYGFFIKKDNNYYKVNTNASSSKSVQLYDYGSSNYGNSSHRVTYKTGSSGKYIFTFDASNNKIVVSPQSETVELVYDKANGHDTWWDLDNKKAMTQDGSNYYYDVDLSKEKYYMFIRINNTIFWRGAKALPHALYYYGDTNFGNSGDKMNYTPTATSKHRFIWNHLDKTLSVKPFYTVTFDANGHGTAPGAQTILSGTKATEPTAPTATGYTFGGWYKEAGCTNAFDFNTAINANITLYAKWTANQYTITYKDQGDVAFSGTHATGYPTKHTYGTATTLKNPTKLGYTFNGWYTTSACTGSAVTSLGATDYTANITLYAKWTINNTYYLTVAAGAGIESVAGSTDPVTLGSTYDIEATPKTGYTFSTWTANPAANAEFADARSENTTVTVKNGSVTVTATATENMSMLTTSNSYTEGNPGYAAPTASVNSIGYETTATVTATTPSGAYTFIGWTLTDCERTDNGDATALTITVRSNGDGVAATVIANYEKIPSKTVYFRPKTDWKNNNPVIICDGNPTAVTSYDCAGEYYTAEVPGGTTNLKFGCDNEQTLPLTVPTDNKVLYDMKSQRITKLYLKANSNWKADGDRFAAYFFGNGDKWVSMTVVAGQTNLYEVAIPTDKSYPSVIFCRMNGGNQTNGWSNKLNQTADLTIPTDGTNRADLPTNVNDGANVTWHTEWDDSRWKEFTAPTYNITLDQTDGGTIAVSKNSDITLNEQVTVTMTADPGYSFQSGTIKIGNQEEQTFTETETTHIICGDAIITAEWKPDTHTVTFNANGHGTAPDEQSVDHNEKVEEPEAPTADGYTFGGWYTDANCTTAWRFDTDVVTADMTLYAKWTPTEYTITYNDLYGVTHSNPGTYTIESETITFTAPTSTRTGYDFAGWDPTEIEKGSTGNQTVTAQWTEILSTITITTNPAEGGNVTVDDELFTPGNTVQVGVATSKKVTAVPNPGYGVATWTVSSNDIVRASGSETVTLKADGSGREGTLCANFVGLEYTITFNKQEGTGGTDKATVNYKNNNYSVDPVEVPNRTGYTFGGYYTEANGAGVQVVSAEGAWLSNATGYTDADGKWLVHENTTLYAQWTAKTYTVTLDQTEAKVEGTTSVTATYDAAMPTATMPTAADGYVFMGYWDSENDEGTQYYNADGTSAHVWDKADNATLYAHFVKVEITAITLDKSTFEPVEAGCEGYVTATPTLEPTPTNDVIVCWRLLYNNGNEVPGRSAQEVSGNIVKFSIAGLAAGTYKIEAVLRTGSNCGSGDVLSTKTVNFTIASNYTITVKYTCDGKEIMAASKVPARVSEETEITAPNITGYTFSSWEAGDGVTIKSTNGNSVKITAIYDGYLTAKYTARPMVYFKNTLGWEKVYVYTFSDNAWWNDGTGVHPATNKLEQGEMTQIGESDVYYFELDKPDSDYTQDNNANPNYIAFSNKDMRTENGAFWECDAIYRGDHKAELTLFVPQKDQTPETHNKTKYYSKGIWMKYNSTESGYQLPGTIPNDDPDHDGWGTYGNKFTAQTPGGYTFSITKYLEANTEYTFKIKNYVWVKDYNNTDNNQWFGYDGTINNSTTNWLHFKGDNDEGKNNGDAKIKTTAEGEYTFTIDLSQGKVLLSVEYPIEVGDYRVIYKDNATWSHASAHDANWYHPSRIIKKNKTAEPTKDIISFFISYGQSTTMQFQRVKSITNGNVTWENAGEVAKIPDAVNEAGVYNFIVTQTANGASISMEDSAEPYTGNYYIRVDALAGKWDNYKTNPENRMTYSAFSESEANSFGDKYSHYATKYCDEGTNIKFVIANDYSPCISDTLAKDVKVNGANPFNNLDEHGTIISDYQQNKANVRFMWNHKTNKISRVYIGSAAEAQRHFLVLKSNNEMKGEDGQNLRNEGDDHAKRKAVFKDTQNWMYERTIKVQPGTRVKLYACYPMDNNSGVDAAEQKAQYFRGAYDGDIWNEKNSIVILGGSGTDWNTIRVIYDFKTNRLMAALVPDQEVSGEKTIAADVMIIRKHQDAATSITLTNDNSKLKDVKTVYGSLQLNRWVLNNRSNPELTGIEYCTKKVNNQDTYDEGVTNEYHPVLPPGEQKSIYERALYFISFPFDVHLSDVFGFGTYGTHWVISDYNGLRRAQRGYFAEDCINEDCTNWDYIWDPSNFTLKANQGYLLSLDLDLMRYDNTDFWLHNIDQVELFFPSTANLATIEKTSYTMPALSEEYLCKINHNTDGTTPDRDRRVKDSYWRCIGVPSFADYDGSLYKSKEDAEADKYPINWNTDYTWTADESGFPFLYEWNVTDNSLSVQNTSKYQFKPTFAYLVQNGGAIHWKAVNSKPSSVIARQRTETARNYEWKIALMRDGNQEDQTFVRITDNENVTTSFDFNQDLAKEFNYGRSDIYTLIGYERAAANSMPCSDETTIIPLGLNIEQAGDYTIAMPEGVENIGITLVDNETGIHTNLSAGQEYILTLNKGICENRLFIEVSPIQHSTTDLEYTTEDTREQTTRKILIDGMLYLIRDGVIYDAQGHKL